MLPTSDAPADRWSTRWLFEFLASRDGWGRWLPVEDPKVRADIERLGSYSVLMRPGFRVIGFNNIYCVSTNFWHLLDQSDPQGSLAWLVDELQHAEDNGELVHLLAHVPPGFQNINNTRGVVPEGCYPVRANSYQNL